MTLEDVLEDVRRLRREQPALVFDLDSTLYSTRERNLFILREFAQNGPPQIQAIAHRLRPQDMGWNINEDLAAQGVTDATLLAQIKQFWTERFFRDAYLHHDVPLPGAVAFVRAVHQAGALVYYLTGRDEPNMGKGTRESLRAHGFPVDSDPRVILRMKPDFETPDLDFKREVIHELSELGHVYAFFENEPANANMFSEAFPDAHVFLLDTIHAPDPPEPDPRIVRLRDFELSRA